MAFKNRQVIALIPARGGSKGVIRKNLRLVLGKPLLTHTVQAALGSIEIDSIFVSSEDPEILKLAHDLGVASVTRAVEAATDTAGANQVVLDFLHYLSSETINADPYLVFLQPTSPLRNAGHIDAAFAEMLEQDCDICLSVTVLKKTPFKSFTLTSMGRLQSLFDEAMTNANRQNLPTAYYPNGAIYIFPISEFLRKGSFPSNSGVPLVMSERDSIDIDTEEDLAMVEKLCLPN